MPDGIELGAAAQSPPKRAPPPGAWDCHTHVFGPHARFPLAAERSYTPPEAPLEAYLALLDRVGLEHGVPVHASAYGVDHSALLDALWSKIRRGCTDWDGKQLRHACSSAFKRR